MFYRIVILLCCLSFMIGAEIEQIKLKDGRVFIGTYDKKEGVIVLNGPIKGGVRVNEEDIVERSPVPEKKADPPEELATDKATPETNEESEKKAAPAPVDPNIKLIDKQKKYIAKKESDLKSVENKIDKTKINIYRFRQQFALRARSEGRYYNPEVPEHSFLEEHPIELPKSRVNNSGVRGLIMECKKLMAEHEQLKKDLDSGTKALADLEAAAAENKVNP